MFRHLQPSWSGLILIVIIIIIIVITNSCQIIENPAGTFVSMVFQVQWKEGLSTLTTSENNTNHRWSPGITFPAGIIVI